MVVLLIYPNFESRAGVVFGSGVPFVGSVLDNLLALVDTLGANGLVGLIVLAVLLDLYN